MILYGGHDGTRHLSDTHIFDFDTSTWSSLVCEGTQQPIPRDSHVSVRSILFQCSRVTETVGSFCLCF